MRLTLLLPALLLYSNVFSQISGKIISTDKQPVSFANVVLLNGDSAFVAGVNADENGVFRLKAINTGTYFVKITLIGFKKYKSDVVSIKSINQTIDLGDIVLPNDSKLLNEVVVTGKKNLIQNTPTGKVINVQGSLLTSGSTALQVLERIPGVIIDKRNSAISLNGQTGVSVMVNGKMQKLSQAELLNLLNSMSGDNIDKIELVNASTAKYDAESSAGLINIVVKKNENMGTNVQWSGAMGYGYKEKANTALNLNHGTKNINYYFNYSFLHNRNISSWHALASADVPSVGGYYDSDFLSTTRGNSNSRNMTLGADYTLRNGTLGGSLSIFRTNSKPTVDNDAYYGFQNIPGFKMLSKSLSKSNWNSEQSNVFIEKKISGKTTMNLDVDYLHFKNDNPANINSLFFDLQGNRLDPSNDAFTEGNRSQSSSIIKIGVLKADFKSQLSRRISFDWGIKASLTTNSNESSIERMIEGKWEVDNRSQNTLSGTENIFAAYVSSEISLSDKTTLTAGLRYEYWQREFNKQQSSKRVGQWFPAIHYSHKISETKSWVVSVNRKINRPNYNDLVSNLFYNDPTSVFTGNPLLMPSISSELNTEYLFNGFSAGIRLQYIDKPIIRYQLSSNAAKEILVLSPQNLDYQYSLNLNINAPWQPTNKWKINMGGTGSYRKYKLLHTPVRATKQYVAFNTFLNNNFQLPRNLEIELASWYNSAVYDGPNRVKGFGVVNIGVSKILKGNRGTIQFSINDIFKSMDIYTKLGVVTPVVFIQKSNVHYRDETSYNRIFKISYTRNFGIDTKRTNRVKSAEEEKERVRM